MNLKNGYRWNILGLATFCLLTFGVIFQGIPPLIRILVNVFNISYAKAGALMGIFNTPIDFFVASQWYAGGPLWIQKSGYCFTFQYGSRIGNSRFGRQLLGYGNWETGGGDRSNRLGRCDTKNCHLMVL